MNSQQAFGYQTSWGTTDNPSDDVFDPTKFGFTPIKANGSARSAFISDAHLYMAIVKNTRNGKESEKKTCRMRLSAELVNLLPIDENSRVGVAIDGNGCVCIYKGTTRKISHIDSQTTCTISLDSMYDTFRQMFGKNADIDYSASPHPSGQAYILKPKR